MNEDFIVTSSECLSFTEIDEMRYTKIYKNFENYICGLKNLILTCAV
jgi:hypothetical protein